MNVPSSSASALSRALSAIEKLEARLRHAERAQREPIAVIGIGCRFPGGVEGPESFLALLREGRDVVSEVPAERWNVDDWYDPAPTARGKSYCRHGAFLSHIDAFDADFFRMSPHEAARTDPQQRLALEVAWEALEHAGIPAQRLTGSRTGVFMGAAQAEYTHQLDTQPLAQQDLHRFLGVSLDFNAARISYHLGLHGPALVVDTACSSSLVAVHLACQSLRAGDCDLALAGGVNALLCPESYVIMSRGRMLSRSGRCRTFDAGADGIVRGEGCGVVVLKPLGRAMADGDRILALIRGSALNQDGASSGLTVPNRAAQEMLLRDALNAAGLAAHEVGYVEAHGTGTPLGDPIELRALGAALCRDRASSNPLRVGSVKTNMGHLEAASGIAGFIKGVLTLEAREIFPNLHFERPTDQVRWSDYALEVPTRRIAWDAAQRYVGVSSFGASGTNAHVLLEAAPRPDAAPTVRADAAPRAPALLALSARSPEALQAQAQRYREHLARHPEQALEALCFSANVGRSQLGYRKALVCASRAELAAELENAASWTPPARPPGTTSSVLFVFGPELPEELPRLAAQLMERPAFRQAVERCAARMPPRAAELLAGALAKGAGAEGAAHADAALLSFAWQWALAQLWQSWGVTPAGALGYGLGQWVADCVAGRRPLEDVLASLSQLPARVQPPPTASDLTRDAASQGADVVLAFAARLMPSARQGGALPWLSAMDTPRALSQLYELGASIAWPAVYAGAALERVDLPTYAFQRRRYWIERTSKPAESQAQSCGSRLRPMALTLPGVTQRVYQGSIGGAVPTVLGEQRLHGSRIVPSGALLELAMAIAKDTRANAGLSALELPEPLPWPEQADRTLQVTLEEQTAQGHLEIVSFSRAANGEAQDVRVHLRAELEPSPAGRAPRELPSTEDAHSSALEPSRLYALLSALGLSLGDGLRRLSGVERWPREVRGVIRAGLDAAAPPHPAVLESCLLCAAPLLHAHDDPASAAPHVLVGVDELSWSSEPAGALTCRASLASAHTGAASLDVNVYDTESRRLVLSMVGARFAPLTPEALRRCLPAPAAEAVCAAAPPLLEQWRELPEARRFEALIEHVSRRVGAVLGLAATDSLARERELSELGMDSLMAVDLGHLLSRDLARSLPPELVADPASVLDLSRKLARHLATELALDLGPEPRRDGGAHACRPNRFKPLEERRKAELRVLCLPYAGGSSYAYTGWLRHLPGNIELRSAQLPGRDERRREPAHRSIDGMVDELWPDLLALQDRPCALFGHSMGAVVAFELARRLERERRVSPRVLIVSGRIAPQLRMRSAPIHTLADPAFVRALQRYEGAHRSVMGNAEVMRIFLPTLRAEVTAIEQYVAREAPPLSCPIVACGGLSDDGCLEHELAAWRAQTRGSFQLHMFPGGHFYLRDQESLLLGAIGEALGTAARTAHPSGADLLEAAALHTP